MATLTIPAKAHSGAGSVAAQTHHAPGNTTQSSTGAQHVIQAGRDPQAAFELPGGVVRVDN
jgi:hypothetical protein